MQRLTFAFFDRLQAIKLVSEVMFCSGGILEMMVMRGILARSICDAIVRLVFERSALQHLGGGGRPHKPPDLEGFLGFVGKNLDSPSSKRKAGVGC